MRALRTEWATALMFLTRLPVFGFGSGDPGVLARATRWFPLVGAVTGGSVALALGLGMLAFPPETAPGVAVVVALVAGVLVTGAFHEDGLADMADSAGAFGRDAKLEIMRDSRVGTYGALALILLLLAKFALLGALVGQGGRVATAIVAAHVLARWSSVWLMAREPYARAGAANRVVAEGVDNRALWHASGVALLVLLALAAASGSVSPAIALLVFAPVVTLGIAVVAGSRVRRTLGGITGDALGAVNQLVEVGVLAVAVLVLR